MTLVLILLIVGAIIFFTLRNTGAAPSLIGGNIPVSNVISHWSHFFHSFNMSSVDFYGKLEEILKSHNMPNSTISRTTHKEAGMLSASREYLRIKHGDIVFDICAAPFGTDFFISWWLYESAGAMRTVFKNTRFGNYLQARAANRTFYQVDEEDMFRSCVHECILESIEKVSEGKGFRALTTEEKAFKMGGL
ncbi:MAG: hypothetical protein JST02_01070 [Bacteroidetes bacterium]|nr:hypothetical protein [Bacteroidota bacterium]